MNNSHITNSDTLKDYRLRVLLLGQELWQEINQVRRMNIALQLADAATTLARMEAEELQEQHSKEFRQLWERVDPQIVENH